jgi:glutamate dehydrogenase/leucine dehydrogenase
MSIPAAFRIKLHRVCGRAEKIRTNTAEVLERSAEAGAPPRQAAVALAKARVRTAMEYRRWK